MSQTLSASTLLAVPLAPLVGAALAGIFGTTFGGNWIGRRLSHTLTILGVFIIGVLRNGLVLIGISPFWQETIIGLVIILAVGLDKWTSARRKATR